MALERKRRMEVKAMATLLERTEKELKVPKEKILEEGVHKYLELEREKVEQRVGMGK